MATCVVSTWVRNACRVVSMCGRAGAQEVCIRVCTVVTSQIMMRRVQQGGFEGVVGCQARVLSGTVCETEDVFPCSQLRKKFGGPVNVLLRDRAVLDSCSCQFVHTTMRRAVRTPVLFLL